MKCDEFLAKYLPFAKQDTVVPYHLTLAQAILESGWGEYAKGNNFFGVKCGKSWTGEKQLITTTEVHNSPNVKYPMVISILPLNNGKFKYRVKDWFRAYKTPLESFQDHSKVMVRNWGKCITADALETIKCIQAGKLKYATDPDYVIKMEKLIDRIKQYEKEHP